MKVRLAALGSTRGTDLRAIIDAIEGGKLDAEIVLVFSNKADAYILERARKHNIETLFIDHRKYGKREDFDRLVVAALKERKADIVLLIGYMRIISPYFCREFEGRIWNIHPSLLPKYAGGMDTNVHEEVLKNKEKETGCTLHVVSEKVDAGRIIMQEKVKVLGNDTPDSLKERVQKAEQQLLIKAIKLFSEGKLNIRDLVKSKGR